VRQCSVFGFSFIFLLRNNVGLLFNDKLNINVHLIAWAQHVTLHEMIMMSRLYQTNILSWIGILLEHCNNSLRVDHGSIILIPSQPVFVLCPWLLTYHRDNKYQIK